MFLEEQTFILVWEFLKGTDQILHSVSSNNIANSYLVGVQKMFVRLKY